MVKFFAITLSLILCASAALAGVPPFNHVVVVVLENHSYSSAMANMPWLKALALKYSYMAYCYGNAHPSIGNYFMATTGQTVTNNDRYSGTVTANNLARQFLQPADPEPIPQRA